MIGVRLPQVRGARIDVDEVDRRTGLHRGRGIGERRGIDRAGEPRRDRAVEPEAVEASARPSGSYRRSGCSSESRTDRACCRRCGDADRSETAARSSRRPELVTANSARRRRRIARCRRRARTGSRNVACADTISLGTPRGALSEREYDHTAERRAAAGAGGREAVARLIVGEVDSRRPLRRAARPTIAVSAAADDAVAMLDPDDLRAVDRRLGRCGAVIGDVT